MFSIKNGQLIMYNIDEKYKKYLRLYDFRVSLKENRTAFSVWLRERINKYIRNN